MNELEEKRTVQIQFALRPAVREMPKLSWQLKTITDIRALKQESESAFFFFNEMGSDVPTGSVWPRMD